MKRWLQKQGEELARRLRRDSAGSGKGLLLMYHRVAEVPTDPWALCVRPQHFAEHLEILRQQTHPMDVRTLHRSWQAGTLPANAVAVTFDDGYADNLYNAKRLLERSDVPGTFFLTTGYLGKSREFWWDELAWLLLQPGVLPPTLCLNVNGQERLWPLSEDTYYSQDDAWRDRAWRAWEPGPTARHRAYYALWQVLRPLLDEQRQHLLDQLWNWSGTQQEVRATHRPLSIPEVEVLAHEKLVEIGAHSVTHPVLSAIPAILQHDEIHNSKVSIQEILNRQVTSFAYPYGGQGDYTTKSVAIVQESGFACACSTHPGILGPTTEPFELPRMHVGDWGGDAFAQRLTAWLNA